MEFVLQATVYLWGSQDQRKPRPELEAQTIEECGVLLPGLSSATF